jgi:pimeloyl-ACP methyl ester carboxylesterase
MADGGAASSAPSQSLVALAQRYDPDVFDPGRRSVRVRLAEPAGAAWDVVLSNRTARLEPARGPHDALITADADTFRELAEDLRSGMEAFGFGRLSVRRNLHLGVGFLAATSGSRDPARLRFRTVTTSVARLSTLEAGAGPPVVAIHGLGGTKGSFLTSVAALSDRHRVIAVDLPGFGDSEKPVGAAYDARYFADAMVALFDALGLERPDVIGNSLGGRIALEIGLRHPDRVRRLVLLAPSMAWRRARPWVPLLRLTRPELGLLQITPRPLVEAIVQRLIPAAADGWTAAGVDEFLRAYLNPAGRAAFYAAARHIYLEEPDGKDGFWPRLGTLRAEALFVWGQRDRLVPIAFARHVTEALPRAHHLELDCGHVPQVERPTQTHAAIAAFLGPTSPPAERAGSRT